jgi:hypothetical protein
LIVNLEEVVTGSTTVALAKDSCMLSVAFHLVMIVIYATVAYVTSVTMHKKAVGDSCGIDGSQLALVLPEFFRFELCSKTV